MKDQFKLAFVVIVLFLTSFCSGGVNSKSSAKSLKSITTTDKSVYIEIDSVNNKIQFYIPYKSDLELENFPIYFAISENAKSNISSGKGYDLSEPFELKITAEDGSSNVYTITAQKCDGNKTAVLVSDTQVDIIPLYRQESFFVNLNDVLLKASKANVPIYYIMLSDLKGTSKWDLPSQLKYQEGKIVDKPSVVDAFVVESFRTELLKLGIGTVYVVGVSSMGCVKGTSLGAIENKFNVYVVSDAHAEPIGYRTEASIDECNDFFRGNDDATLILTEDIQF